MNDLNIVEIQIFDFAFETIKEYRFDSFINIIKDDFLISFLFNNKDFGGTISIDNKKFNIGCRVAMKVALAIGNHTYLFFFGDKSIYLNFVNILLECKKSKAKFDFELLDLYTPIFVVSNNLAIKNAFKNNKYPIFIVQSVLKLENNYITINI